MPSHDKERESFVIPDGFSERELRTLNKEADEEATLHLDNALRDSGRAAWAETVDAAETWSAKALQLAAEVGTRFFAAPAR